MRTQWELPYSLSLRKLLLQYVGVQNGAVALRCWSHGDETALCESEFIHRKLISLVQSDFKTRCRLGTLLFKKSFTGKRREGYARRLILLRCKFACGTLVLTCHPLVTTVVNEPRKDYWQ